MKTTINVLHALTTRRQEGRTPHRGGFREAKALTTHRQEGRTPHRGGFREAKALTTRREENMDWLLTRLNILADGLEKKERALSEIVSITENQGTVLQSGLSENETRAFIVQMNREKQQFINQVIQCDNMFERILKEAGPALDAAPENYKPQVQELQARIRRVMDLDVKIRVYEENNNTATRGKKPGEITDIQPAAAVRPRADNPSGLPPATADLPPQKPARRQRPIQPDTSRIIKAYAKNTRNYKEEE